MRFLVWERNVHHHDVEGAGGRLVYLVFLLLKVDAFDLADN